MVSPRRFAKISPITSSLLAARRLGEGARWSFPMIPTSLSRTSRPCAHRVTAAPQVQIFSHYRWPILSEAQIERIRDAALAHIERHGFVVEDAELLARAKARGAQVTSTRVFSKLCAEVFAGFGTSPLNSTIMLVGPNLNVGTSVPFFRQMPVVVEPNMIFIDSDLDRDYLPLRTR